MGLRHGQKIKDTPLCFLCRVKRWSSVAFFFSLCNLCHRLDILLPLLLFEELIICIWFSCSRLFSAGSCCGDWVTCTQSNVSPAHWNNQTFLLCDQRHTHIYCLWGPLLAIISSIQRICLFAMSFWGRLLPFFYRSTRSLLHTHLSCRVTTQAEDVLILCSRWVSICTVSIGQEMPGDIQLRST